jgi:hypothetical protein
VGLNVKYDFENIRKGNLLRSSHDVAMKIEDREALLESTISGLLDVKFWKMRSAELKTLRT